MYTWMCFFCPTQLPGRWKLEFWQIISPESTDGMERCSGRNKTSKADCCIDLVMRLRAFERQGVCFAVQRVGFIGLIKPSKTRSGGFQSMGYPQLSSTLIYFNRMFRPWNKASSFWRSPFMVTSIPGIWNPLGISIGGSHNQVRGCPWSNNCKGLSRFFSLLIRSKIITKRSLKLKILSTYPPPPYSTKLIVITLFETNMPFTISC